MSVVTGIVKWSRISSNLILYAVSRWMMAHRLSFCGEKESLKVDQIEISAHEKQNHYWVKVLISLKLLQNYGTFLKFNIFELTARNEERYWFKTFNEAIQFEWNAFWLWSTTAMLEFIGEIRYGPIRIFVTEAYNRGKPDEKVITQHLKIWNELITICWPFQYDFQFVILH